MSTPRQPGFVLWLTGLPSSGKSSLADELERLLAERGVNVQVLDSDKLRQVLTPDPTYTPQERDRFYEALATIAALLARNGVNVIVAATASRRRHRQAGRQRVERFAEIYVHCPVEVCRSRDIKGLWRRSDAGQISNLPGAGAPYEPPRAPEVRVETARLSAQEGAQHVIARLDAQEFWDMDG